MYELYVLINGRRVSEYKHDIDTYIEGRPGSEYELELVNKSYQDAEFVVSVDGLSINTGKAAGRTSSGYIVRGNSSVTIKGWLVDNNNAAKFKIGAKGKSYAAKSKEGSVTNAGVIGLQVFTQKPVIRHRVPEVPNIPYDNHWFGATKLGNPSWSYTNNSSDASQLAARPEAISKSAIRSLNYTSGSVAKGVTPPSDGSMSSFTSSVGTEFGEAAQFKTTTVSFERASDTPVSSRAIYYGDKNDLNKLGIVLDWQRTTPVKPNAFPADTYCVPPTGWKGRNT